MEKIEQTTQKRRSTQPLKIYRVNTANEENTRILADKYQANINNETILLLKNPYGPTLVNIDFDMYIQYPQLLSVYMTDLSVYRTKVDFQERLSKMPANEACLVFVTDLSTP